MKTIILFLYLLPTSFLLAQSEKEKTTERTIDVTGVAEMSITPNEVVFKISLTEKLENKEKITIEKQEIALKDGLTKIGIDAQKDLQIMDLSSIYTAQKRKKDVLGSKNYRLTIRDMSKIGLLQDLADELNFNRLDLILSTHTDLPKYRKQVKIEATKAAKEKAEYMLAAIGSKLGKPIYVHEVSDNDYKYRDEYQDLDPYRGNSFVRKVITSDDQSGVDVKDKNFGVKDIVLKFSVFIKFEIE